MENTNLSGILDQSVQTPIIPQKNIFKLLFFISIILLSILVFYIYFNFKTNNTTSKEISINQIPTTTVEKEEIKWNTAKIALYLFDYPFGWHVTDLNESSPDYDRIIIINSEPITTGGRGGPRGDIVIFNKSGLSNPEESFQQSILEYKRKKPGSKEEILNTENGKIFHYTGSMYSEMTGEDEYYEDYFLFIKPKSATDIISNQIIKIGAYNKSNSDILKHIVLSIKPN